MPSNVSKERRDELRSKIRHQSSPVELMPAVLDGLLNMADRAEAAEVERDRFKERDDMHSDFLAFMHDELSRFGCRCGPTGHAATPPMMWPEWVACIIAKRVETVKAERDRLAEENNGLKQLLEAAKTHAPPGLGFPSDGCEST